MGIKERIALIIQKSYLTPCRYIENVNRSKAAAISERPITNARHAVWDGNRSQAAAVLES